MGDPHRSDGNRKMESFSLPPGCRFHPSEEQLLCYYLTNKNKSSEEEDTNLCDNDLIKELDLYEHEPYELPETTCYAYGYRGRKRHWYCYGRVSVVKGSKCRKGKNGYWRRRGRVTEVVVRNTSCNNYNNNNNNKRGKLVLGTRTSFVFYLGNSLKTAVRTHWLMHEYALDDHVKASFVLSRIFVKSRGGNSKSEVSLSSGAGESVSAVRHIGIQHDGFLIPDSSEGKVDDDNSIDRRNDTCIYPVRMVSQLDDHVTSRPVSDASFQFPAGIPSKEQVSTSGLAGTSLLTDAVETQQLQSILEEDFIELDDLVP